MADDDKPNEREEIKVQVPQTETEPASGPKINIQMQDSGLRLRLRQVQFGERIGDLVPRNTEENSTSDTPTCPRNPVPSPDPSDDGADEPDGPREE